MAFNGRRVVRTFTLCCMTGAAIAVGACDNPTGPSRGNLTGTWQGTSSYFNAPFRIVLEQNGSRLSGRYEDTFDAGTVRGDVTGDQVLIGVDFGDTGINLTGTIRTAREIGGTITGAVIGGTYPFVMTR